MISRLIKLPISAIFLFLVTTLQCLAQPAQEMSKFKAKYPGHSVISEIRRKEITITAGNKGLPEVRSTNMSSLMLLTGNVTTYADSKEYFNKNFKLNYLKAYSLLPGEREYKKAEVSEFSKSSEINSGLYFDDNYSMGFTFPSVGPGVKMITESEIVYASAYYPILFYFGSSIPSDSSVLEITMPESVSLNYKIFGSDTNLVHFSKSIKGKKVVYQWYTSGLKAYQSDEYSPDVSYYIPHIIIHIASVNQKEAVLPIMGTCNDLYKWHYGHISKLDSVDSPEIQKLVDFLVSGIHDDTEKVKTIYRWVQKNVKYIAIEDGDNGQVPGEASEVLAHRYGDCKGKSSLLRAMLRAAGLKASLAWIGSRDIPYKYSEFPSMSNDDHMICIWWNKGEPVVLDGTTENHSLGQIPSFIQGKESMVENGPDKFELITLPVARPEINAITDTTWLSISNSKLSGRGSSTLNGERKSDLLSILDATEPSKYKELLGNFLQFTSNKFQGLSVTTSDQELIDQPFTLNYEFEIPDYVTTNAGLSYVNLNVERIYQKVSIKPDRTQPFETDFSFTHSFVSILDLPEGTKASALPEALAYEHPLFSFHSSYSQQGNRIILNSTITVDYLLIKGDDLQGFREMLILMNKAYSKSIVLNKIQS